MIVLEGACDFFTRHVAQLCGIPFAWSNDISPNFVMKSAQDVAQETMLRLVKSKVGRVHASYY